jgi:ribosomal protein S27AE
MPSFVVVELRGHLTCGVLAHGAVRFACGHCGEDRLVGLSCPGRGFCPRCLGRRMTEMARHWAIPSWPWGRPPSPRFSSGSRGVPMLATDDY